MNKLVYKCVFIIMFALLSALGLQILMIDTASEADDNIPEAQEDTKITETTNLSPTQSPTSEYTNSLTGLPISEQDYPLRPTAVVINNIHAALPQSGISQADIVYEVLAEGDITRLVAIFKDFDSKKIGPVRSARDYFLDMAADYDAIFVHHGGSPDAYSQIDSLGVNDIDGMEYDGTYFWRDQERVDEGLYEHSSYTNKEDIEAAIADKGYERNLPSNIQSESPFSFYENEAAPAGGTSVTNISLPFSYDYITNFEYDSSTRQYLMSDEDSPKIDEETGNQLAFTNVMVQFTNMYVIPGDDKGRRSVELVGSGDGYLFTDGTCVPITWSKASYEAPTQWFDMNGNNLSVNKGKTYIGVFDDGGQIQYN